MKLTRLAAGDYLTADKHFRIQRGVFPYFCKKGHRNRDKSWCRGNAFHVAFIWLLIDTRHGAVVAEYRSLRMLREHLKRLYSGSGSLTASDALSRVAQ